MHSSIMQIIIIIILFFNFLTGIQNAVKHHHLQAVTLALSQGIATLGDTKPFAKLKKNNLIIGSPTLNFKHGIKHIVLRFIPSYVIFGGKIEHSKLI